MTPEQFFEKFDQIADAPDAVAKMRELVLSLAVCGRLVNQGRAEETVEELLTRCLNRRQELGLTKRTSVRDIDRTDALGFDIPKAWKWQALEDILIFGPSNGFSPKAVDYETPVRSLTLTATRSGRFLPEHSKFLVTDIQNDSSLWLQDGDILVQRGNTLDYVGVAAVYRGGSHRFIYPDLMMKIRVFSELDVDYVHLAMSQKNARDYLRDRASGTSGSMPKINQATLKSLPLPIPPLAEQQRIVAKVDELMDLCDQLEAQQQERETRHTALARASLARFADAPTPANLSFLFHKSYDISPAELRRSILELAVRGELVRFDADTQTGTVGDSVEFLNGYAFKSEWFKPKGVRLCRNANVSHGLLDWRGAAFVDNTVAKEFHRFALREGDVVLSLDRPLISTGLKVAKVRKKDLPCLLLQRVAKCVPRHNDLDLDYFLLWLQSPEFVDSIDPGRSNGVPHISTRHLQQLPFVLPSLPEQRRIVAKVDQLMSLVDKLEAQLTNSRATATKLLEAVVAELAA